MIGEIIWCFSCFFLFIFLPAWIMDIYFNKYTYDDMDLEFDNKNKEVFFKINIRKEGGNG
jgi:hypothetical protein